MFLHMFACFLHAFCMFCMFCSQIGTYLVRPNSTCDSFCLSYVVHLDKVEHTDIRRVPPSHSSNTNSADSQQGAETFQLVGKSDAVSTASIVLSIVVFRPHNLLCRGRKIMICVAFFFAEEASIFPVSPTVEFLNFPFFNLRICHKFLLLCVYRVK